MIEDVLRATVKTILEQAEHYEGWTLQGLGMLRLRLDKWHRLHVWSHAHRVPNVTPIHDHPWNLVSHVISGEIEDIQYTTVDEESDANMWAKRMAYVEQEIVCGPKGCALGEPVPVWLVEYDRATFLGGQDYGHYYFNLHESRPSDGAVSLIETWTPDHVDKDRAHVYIEQGKQWVSAEPRAATLEEVKTITRRALERWA